MSTSSDTVVIKCSSVSTLTRIDWLATLPSAGSSSRLAVSAASPVLGRGLLLGAMGSASARKARSSSSAETSPGGGCNCRASPAGPRSAARRSSAAIRSRSSPACSAWLRSSSLSSTLMRSMVARMSVTASRVTGMPSRNLPISASAACVSASSRGRLRKPQVPLMVWTRRKMLPRIFALFGSCSKRTSSTSTTSMLSFVSVRNSRSSSSMAN